MAIQLVLWPALALGAEFALRAFDALRGRSFDRARAHQDLVEIREANRGFVPRPNRDLPWSPAEEAASERVLHPYTGFEIVGGMKQLADTLRELRGVDRSKLCVVAIFGGSVAQFFGQTGVAEVLTALRADPQFANQELRAVSLGRGGFREPQQQAFLAYVLTLGLPIRVVINLDGFNEVAIGNENAKLGTHPSFPSISHWSQLVARGADDPAALEIAADVRSAQRSIESLCALALDHGFERSALVSRLTVLRLHAMQADVRERDVEYTERLKSPALRRVLAGPHVPSDEKAPIEASVRIWSESSTDMRAMCEGRGILYFHVLQPTLHDPGSKPVTDRERELGAISESWREGVEQGYPLLRAEGARLAEKGEAFFDASRVFADVRETLYFDACHFNESGNGILGRAIGSALVASLHHR